MKSESKTIDSLFGKGRHITFTYEDVHLAMRTFADQFRYVKTTCGKNIEFDDKDYYLLRSKQVFWDTRRECVSAVWFSETGKRIVAPIAKLILGVTDKSVIHYNDGDPLNLKRENIKLVSKQVAHYKSKKQRTSSGEIPTSKYKGVSFKKSANKWEANIKLDYKKKHLGYFISEEDAALAYNKAAIENWGAEHSNLNVVVLSSNSKKTKTNKKR